MKSNKHLKFIRSLPCLICGNEIETEAAHVRYASALVAKTESGIGRKPENKWTVPLCSGHHREQHTMGEYKFWQSIGIDPLYVALALWDATGDHERGTKIVTAWRHVIS